MISATDLKNGTTFKYDSRPFKVVKYTHQKIGRGGANVKLKVRDLSSGDLEEKTLNSTVKVEEIATRKRPLQFLYSDSQTATFMDSKTYEQIEIPASLVKDELSFIKEGEEVNVLFWDDPPSSEASKPLSIDISPKVVLEVADTAPGVKGNSATNLFKSAVLENQLKIKVPLFIKTGDKVVVDTRTREYVERAK